ncbi:NUDIX hydrolase [Paractinoplanes durhamensis]|uniref:hypothetical protein n=1 Tax=Paractinoplanes durhamensis TaxID=113563 RepID=UPI0036278310
MPVTEDRRAAYDRLRAERPRLFVNPPGVPLEIVFDEELQEQAGDIGVLYADEYLVLVKDAVRFPSGRIGTYIRTVPAVDGEAVVVFATAPDGRVALARHFRHGCREWHWEVARGSPSRGPTARRTRPRRCARSWASRPPRSASWAGWTSRSPNTGSASTTRWPTFRTGRR